MPQVGVTEIIDCIDISPCLEEQGDNGCVVVMYCLNEGYVAMECPAVLLCTCCLQVQRDVRIVFNRGVDKSRSLNRVFFLLIRFA